MRNQTERHKVLPGAQAEFIMNKELAIKLIGLLKSESEILSIMEKTNYNWKVCQAGISLLKSESQILSIMEKTNYDEDVCQAGMEELEKRASK